MSLAALPRRLKPTGPRLAGGAPIYTPEQFALVRPHGSYDAYRKFVSTRRGLTQGPAYPGSGGPGLPTYMSLLNSLGSSGGGLYETPAQMEARAKRMADYSYKSQAQVVTDDAARARQEATDRMNAIAAAGRAAAQMNAGMFGAVGGEYNAAAKEISNLATGLAGGAGAQTAQDVANINEAIGRVGAPGVEATGALAGPGQVGVETFRGGTLPAQDLQTQGQAAQFGLAGLVSSQNLRATQEATAGLRDAGRDIADNRAAALRELAAGRPELAAKYLDQFQQGHRDTIALAMSLIAARRGALQTGFNQKITVRQQNRADRELTASINQAKDAAKIDKRAVDVDRSMALGYYVDKMGRPVMGKNGQPIQVPTKIDADRSIALGYYVDDRGQPVLRNGKKIKVPASVTKGTKITAPTIHTGDVASGTVRANLDEMLPSVTAIYYGAGDPTTPKLQAQASQRVINHIVNTQWPQVSVQYPANQRAKYLKRFRTAVSNWFKTVALPDYNSWSISRLKGE